MSRSVITVRDVGCVLGGATVLRGADLEVPSGQVVVVVGPNGAGKSTLLGVISGDLPYTGSVLLDGQELGEWSTGDLARRRAVMTQAHDVSFGFSVREVVAMGRHPWTSRDDVVRDAALIDDALRETDTTHLVDRTFRSLSGGEKARVSLARVLAQDTDLLLLDEPTAALDLRHTEEVLGLARRMARRGRTVVVVAHDLTLASAYADVLAVVDGGRVTAAGPPVDVLTPALVAQTYGLEVEVHQVRERLVVVPI